MSIATRTETPVIPQLDASLFVDVDIYGEDVKSNPWPLYQKWASSPPFYVMMYGRPNAVICRYEDLRRAFTDHETFSVVPQKGWGGDYLSYFNGLPVVTELDPPDHSRLRRLMQPAFTPRRVAQFQQQLETLVEEMLGGLAAKGSFEMMSELASPLTRSLLLGAFFEFPVEDWSTFIELSHQAFTAIEPGAPRTQAFMDAIHAGHEYCGRLIEKRRSEPKDDLVGNIIAAHDDGHVITNEELFAMLLVLFSAGLATVASSIGLSTLRLCRHRDQLKLLQDDPSLINSAVEECLRIDSHAIYRHRFVMKDTIIDGVPLYRGMIAHLSMAASNYDPSVFPDPNRFDIRRNPKDINTFGFGAHFCIGQVLARTVLRTAIGRLVQRFPRLRLADLDAKIVHAGAPQERMLQSLSLRID